MHLILFTGLQACGKSTFYKTKFSDTHIRLNLDMLRTRHRERILYQACLEAKQPVVIDNTNPTREERKYYLALARKHKFQVSGYYFISDLRSALLRNAMRGEKAQVPEKGIRATLKKMQPPAIDEGFDCLYSVVLNGQGYEVRKWPDEVF